MERQQEAEKPKAKHICLCCSCCSGPCHSGYSPPPPVLATTPLWLLPQLLKTTYPHHPLNQAGRCMMGIQVLGGRDWQTPEACWSVNQTETLCLNNSNSDNVEKRSRKDIPSQPPAFSRPHVSEGIYSHGCSHTCTIHKRKDEKGKYKTLPPDKL